MGRFGWHRFPSRRSLAGCEPLTPRFATNDLPQRRIDVEASCREAVVFTP